ncbi:MAG: hypothetical protein ACXABY_00445 [Candidatus Thorarchaeota archaeon]|jgi:hypothetical protein
MGGIDWESKVELNIPIEVSVEKLLDALVYGIEPGLTREESHEVYLDLVSWLEEDAGDWRFTRKAFILLGNLLRGSIREWADDAGIAFPEDDELDEAWWKWVKNSLPPEPEEEEDSDA